MLKSALKSKRKRGRRNSLMANNFSKELDRVIVTATLYRPSFTNPFEKRHGIAAKRVARVHGANLAWTIGGGRSITETTPSVFIGSIRGCSVCDVDALRARSSAELRSRASVNRVQIGRQGVEEAGLMGIRRQFRVRNLSSWNVTGILANLFFLRSTREGVKLDGLQNEFLSWRVMGGLAASNRNNCPSFRSRTRKESWDLKLTRFDDLGSRTDVVDKILWSVHWFVMYLYKRSAIVSPFSIFPRFSSSISIWYSVTLQLRSRTILHFYLPKITKNNEKFR